MHTRSATFPYNLQNQNTASVPVPSAAGTASSPPSQMPVPEMPQPVQPIGEPSPMENPIPMREPPATLPPQS